MSCINFSVVRLPKYVPRTRPDLSKSRVDSKCVLPYHLESYNPLLPSSFLLDTLSIVVEYYSPSACWENKANFTSYKQQKKLYWRQYINSMLYFIFSFLIKYIFFILHFQIMYFFSFACLFTFITFISSKCNIYL